MFFLILHFVRKCHACNDTQNGHRNLYLVLCQGRGCYRRNIQRRTERIAMSEMLRQRFESPLSESATPEQRADIEIPSMIIANSHIPLFEENN